MQRICECGQKRSDDCTGSPMGEKLLIDAKNYSNEGISFLIQSWKFTSSRILANVRHVCRKIPNANGGTPKPLSMTRRKQHPTNGLLPLLLNQVVQNLASVDVPTFIRPDKEPPPPTKSSLFLNLSSLPSSSYSVCVSTASISSTSKYPSTSLCKDSTLHIWKFRWSRRKLVPHALNVVDPAAALQQRPNITIKEEFSRFHHPAILP
ncbi:uncharacterized protein EAF02_011170 [Botrytis sinoallii]|uniref:uncharacterized protein n=1 Tax=Botrytis sinoallii TaxID=1463999 RepID=UPI0019024AF5|nr:uncharacterized protein EAF02_011170 [Botrytis sinoallii]KAF7857803.1 hypothetical protein EAF02_011170 [Botrytis sinoallii]